MTRRLPPSLADRAVTMCAWAQSVPPAIVTSDDRSTDAVQARHNAMRILRAMGYSTAEIGRALGRDHSTVSYATRKVAA